MRYELPVKCPICQEKLHVIRLGCDNCESVLEGNFELDRLTQLSKEMRHFIVMFLKYRGNIREMEKHYNISYPTVRARIDDIVASLGEQADTDNDMYADNDADDKSDDADVNRDGAEFLQEAKDSGSAVEPAKSQRLEILTKLSDGEIDIEEARALLDETVN